MFDTPLSSALCKRATAERPFAGPAILTDDGDDDSEKRFAGNNHILC